LSTITSSTRFDHAVILVTDLDRAAADYGHLGFTVTPGGVHAGGATRNALIGFEDGSYLELLSFTRRLISRALPLLNSLGLARLLGSGKDLFEERLRQRAVHGEGLIDYAILPDSLEAHLVRLRREGVRVEGPLEGGRSSGDGRGVTWRMALPGPTELPFFCSDLADSALRVPTGAARDHPNGAVGVAGVVVAVESVETSSARYQALLGSAPDPATQSRIGGARGRLFRVGATDIVVAASRDRSDPIRQHVRHRGEGPYSLRLRCSEPQMEMSLPIRLTHGARIDLVGERASRKSA